MGISNRYHDLAILYRSIKYNFNGTYGKKYNGFNENEFKNIDGVMRSWLEDIDEKDIVNQSNAFKSSGFFGFSAIGCNPQTVNPDDPALDREPRSCRVEDPFLWILKCNNIIKSRKG